MGTPRSRAQQRAARTRAADEAKWADWAAEMVAKVVQALRPRSTWRRSVSDTWVDDYVDPVRCPCGEWVLPGEQAMCMTCGRFMGAAPVEDPEADDRG